MDKHFYAITSGITAIATLGLAYFVFLKGRLNKINRHYSIWTLCVCLWSLFLTLSIYAKSEEFALWFCRILHIFAIMLPAVYVDFVLHFLRREERERKLISILYVLSGIFVLFSFTPMFLTVSYRPEFGFYVTKPGIFYPIHIVVFVSCILYIYIRLILSLVEFRDTERSKQLWYFFIATVVGYSGGLANYLINYNFKIFPLYPLGNATVLLYVVIIGVSIVRHQFMDIEVVIRRTAVFAGLFAFVYGTFTVVTILGQEFFKSTLGWNQWVATIPTVLIITFALRPLEIFLTNATEKFLFQKKYDYRELLKTFTNEVLTVLDLQKLPDQTVSGLIRIMKLESASLLLYDKDNKIYKMAATVGAKEKDISFKDDDTLVRYLKASQQAILKDKSVDKIEGDGVLKDSFKKLNAQLCLPVPLHDELIGILCLGMKKSGEDYTQEDVDILTTLARTEAIAISNAKLFDELSKTQAEAAQREKMAVIGTLAAGINHEICNPLGIVRGHCEMFLLNLRDGLYHGKSVEEMSKIASDIMNKVIKETDRATGITKKLSGFAKPSKRSELEEIYIEKEVDEVLGLIGHDMSVNNIEVQKDFPENFPVITADKKQIQEVLFNIIRNAAQAMDKKPGRIVLSGFSENGSAVIRIADNGSGIPADKIGQIFNPFYTTKAPGKGTGLGLFIVKQVVEKNKGSIAVESEAGVGTTFTLRFPNAAELAAAA